MINDNTWLKQAIIEYVKNRKGKRTNIQDIHGYFKLSIIPETVYQMEKDDELFRENYLLDGWNGHHSDFIK